MNKRDYTGHNLSLIKKKKGIELKLSENKRRESKFNKSGNYGTRFCYLCGRQTIFKCLKCGNFVCSLCGFNIVSHYFEDGKRKKYDKGMKSGIAGRLCKKCNQELNLVREQLKKEGR